MDTQSMLASRLLDLLFIARFFYFTGCIMDQTTLEHLFFKRFSVFSSGNLSQTSGWRMFFSESPMRLVCTLCVSRSTTARRMDDQPCLPLWYLRSSDSFFSQCLNAHRILFPDRIETMIRVAVNSGIDLVSSRIHDRTLPQVSFLSNEGARLK